MMPQTIIEICNASMPSIIAAAEHKIGKRCLSMMEPHPTISTTQTVQGFRTMEMSVGLTKLLMINKERVCYFYSQMLHFIVQETDPGRQSLHMLSQPRKLFQGQDTERAQGRKNQCSAFPPLPQK